jgi:hypothetical protein
MRALQGRVPVISLSFADVKAPTFADMLKSICDIVAALFDRHIYLRTWKELTDNERMRLDAVSPKMDSVTCTRSLKLLCDVLSRYWHMNPVVVLDEYDAPMERAWTGGYWDEASDFMRQLMNYTFKTNPSLGRALITGVTRVGRESIFSGLNNLEVITTSSSKYQTAFGFTQQEVDAALEEYGLTAKCQTVKDWYDGFTFGGVPNVYNPWSITKYLESRGILAAYWANTSGNDLISMVVRHADRGVKADFEALLNGSNIEKVIDEQVVFSELETRPDAVWALLLAAGYLTSPGPVPENVEETPRALELTNYEIRLTFDRMVQGWFAEAGPSWNELAECLFAGDTEGATDCLADVCDACMSYFDGVRQTAESHPERFYHGLVLGMLASLRGRWSVESNRESGRGRYDVALVPTDGARGSDPAVVMEFKVFDQRHDKTLEDTVAVAHTQIVKCRYVDGLIARGIARERIRSYGIAFRGKDVLVG